MADCILQEFTKCQTLEGMWVQEKDTERQMDRRRETDTKRIYIYIYIYIGALKCFWQNQDKNDLKMWHMHIIIHLTVLHACLIIFQVSLIL